MTQSDAKEKAILMAAFARIDPVALAVALGSIFGMMLFIATAVLLVSSPYHAFRIAATADELGLRAAASPAGGGSGLTDLLRETGAVAVGRIIGFRRLAGLG